MRKPFTLLLLLLASIMGAKADVRVITDGNFVFEVFDQKGTAKLLRLVNNDVATLEIPRVAHEGSTMFLVNEIGNAALNGCSKIKSLVITDNITTLYKDAFIGCTSLTSIEFQAGSQSLTFLSEWEGDSDKEMLEDSPLEKVVFNRSCSDLPVYKPFRGKKTLREANLGAELRSVPKWIFAECENLQKVTVSEGISQVERNAFSGCTSLATITIPSTVKEMGSQAFNHCDNLAEITSLATVPPLIESSTFSYVNKKKCKLNLPEGSVDAYNAAPYWSEFFDNAGINATGQDETGEAEVWYTLDGIRLAAKPVNRGIYIVRKGTEAHTIQLRQPKH